MVLCEKCLLLQYPGVTTYYCGAKLEWISIYNARKMAGCRFFRPITMEGDGLRKVVYGLERVNKWIISGGIKPIRRPVNIQSAEEYPNSGCLSCCLYGLTCRKRELAPTKMDEHYLDMFIKYRPYTCPIIMKECEEQGRICGRCYKRRIDGRSECDVRKPCCWTCNSILRCLEDSEKMFGDRWTMEYYGVPWEAFVEAVKMLLETDESRIRGLLASACKEQQGSQSRPC